ARLGNWQGWSLVTKVTHLGWLSDPSKVGSTVALELADEPISLSHLPAHVRHSHDAAEPRKVTSVRRKSSGGALRSSPPALARRGLSHARLADRSRRCRAGSLAAAEPLRYHRRQQPRRLADHGGGAGVSRHVARTQIAR